MTSTSLTLQAVLKSTAIRAGLGGAPRSLAGLSAAAKGLAVAVAATEAPVAVVVPADANVEQLVADSRFFLGSLNGSSQHALHKAVLPFPSHEVDPYRGLAPHFDVVAARGRALFGLASGSVRVIVAAASALLPRLSSPERLLAAGSRLVVGAFLEPPDLGDLLVDAGFTPGDPVDAHGEFCVRGGVVDFFPAGDVLPIRAEFAGDALESLRRFDPATQRSIQSLDRVEVLPLRELFEATDSAATDSDQKDRSAWLADYLLRLPGLRVYLSESEASLTAIKRCFQQAVAGFSDKESAGEALPPPDQLFVDELTVARWLASASRLEQLWENQATASEIQHVVCQPVVEFHGRLGDWTDEIKRSRERGDTALLVTGTPGRAERVVELLADYDLVALSIDQADETHGVSLLVATGQLTRGFRLPDAGVQIFAESDVFGEQRKVRKRRTDHTRSFLSDFRDLKAGDHVVHVDHGVGIFVGLKAIPVGSEHHEFMELCYAGQDKLFVPIQQLDLLQKYTGATRTTLDRLGGTSWAKTKTKVRRAMRDMAEELLKLYATRRAKPGYVFSHDAHWHREFADAFEYELTPDQQGAITDIRNDMESSVPMDRLLCGDVGYGKTEVSMRAAFKAVLDGKQVGVLAPTTVLAFQHYQTFADRFAAFPVRIDLISRFRSRAEQKQTLEGLAAGKIDVVIGTHRLLSKDVHFSDLGLLIVDEEQRFGVAHKERIKQMRHSVDVLTMTATPIPRTLNMSLVGIRDMSVIETPPKDRQAIQTNVVRFEQQVIVRAIRTELERGGQVYFLHSRVTSIYAMGELLNRLLPEARVAVAHGQMKEGALEQCMIDFVRHKYDVLLATTIIENGLDIPNANTIIVNHAERFGLAQLYQLRGRVGRSDRRAYAYLLVPPEGTLSPVARQRLAAIREFSELGSGFRVAALDLEIRGAGNLLGGEQSGHIESVGFDLYVKLLEQTVRELKGDPTEEIERATVNLSVDLKIDEQYVSDANQRLMVYRRVASARTEADLITLLDELGDRYGPIPLSVETLVEYGRIRMLADQLGLESLERNGQVLVVKFRPAAPVDPLLLFQFVQKRPDVALKPPATLTVDLRGGAKGNRPPSNPSWWTSRARSNEVEAGFSRVELHRSESSPDTPAWLFSQVGTVLVELRGLQTIES
ncbi:MAG: transcription-repair coupling factor [Acidobacteriota bacterium]|nr:transcription-repair coupling factor [Acidobacteriota bacterium]